MEGKMAIALTVLGCGGFFTLLQFLIQRHDSRKGVLASIQQGMIALRDEFHRDKADSSRRRILNASDEVVRGTAHSKEWWEQTLQDIDIYEKYCDAHSDYKNNKAVMAVANLKEIYAARLDKNDFL